MRKTEKNEQTALFPMPRKVAPVFCAEADIVLYEGDALEFLRTLPSQIAKLVITSPPYNIGKQYERRMAIEASLAQQESIINELIRVLADDGSICWQVGNYVESGEVFPLDVFYYHLFKKRGLKLRNRIIWHFEHGLHAAKRFSGRYETLLWFTKNDTYVFNLDAVRVPSKYPGKTHFKGPKRGKPSGNPLGKNPTDLWRFVSQQWKEEVWDIPNVKANHPEKTIHPCQFPIELVERCVLAFTQEGDWVLDPYCDVGSALLAAVNRRRCGMGSEKSSEYVRVARQRIAAFQNGPLRIRPLGQPVYQPSGREKVVQVPSEWKTEPDENSRRILF